MRHPVAIIKCNNMKKLISIVISLALSIPALLSTPSSVTFIPAFSESDLAIPPGADESTKLLHQQRAALVSVDYLDFEAAEYLLKVKDTETITRLVYALRLGDDRSGQLLESCATIEVIPYLLEDMAHGPNDHRARFVPVRTVAVWIAARTLARTDGFPAETKEWLNHVRSMADQFGGVVQDQTSRLLLVWWLHNEKAIHEGKLSEATWLPPERQITVKPVPPSKSLPTSAQAQSPEVPKTPPYSLGESYQEWVARLARPEGRDLNFVPLHIGGEPNFSRQVQTLETPVSIGTGGNSTEQKGGSIPNAPIR